MTFEDSHAFNCLVFHLQKGKYPEKTQIQKQFYIDFPTLCSGCGYEIIQDAFLQFEMLV